MKRSNNRPLDQTQASESATHSAPHGPAVKPAGTGMSSVLDRTMMLIILAGAFNYLAFGIVTVLLPRLVTDGFGGNDFQVGVIVGTFAIAGVVTRPAAGRLGNKLGRRTLMLVGASLISVSFGLYGIVPFILFLAVLRLVTGAGEAFFYTGAATMVADHAPPDRRTQAIGYYSVAIYIGTGLGPALGEALSRQIGLSETFIVAGAFAAASGFISLGLPNVRIVETGTDRAPLLNRDALVPGSVLALGVCGIVAFQAYVPLYTDDLGMNGAQYVFLLYSAIMIAIRAFASPVHRMQPRLGAAFGVIGVMLGLTTIASVASPITLYAGTVLLACGFAVLFPALMTMVVNRASERERASAVGTYTAFMNLSLGIGGFLLAIPAEVYGYRASFACGAALAACSLVLLFKTTSAGD